MSGYSRYGDRNPSGSRRDSSSSSHRDSSSSSRRDRDSRRSNPGPSRGRSPPPPVQPRDQNELPAEFGRPSEPISKEDENTVLKRMKTAFKHSPLSVLNESIRDKQKVKVWTRNFKDVRGICTGYVVAFDKHWNLVLSDVEEQYLKPRKAKTPFLLDVKDCADLKELPPKVPRVKKTKTPEESAEKSPEDEAATKSSEEKTAKKSSEEEKVEGSDEEEAKKSPDEAAAAKKQKKKKKRSPRVHKRLIEKLFIRGDNIVICAVERTTELND